MEAEYHYKKYIEEKEKLPKLLETDEEKAQFFEALNSATAMMREIMRKYEFSSIGEYKATILNQKYIISDVLEVLDKINSTAEKLIFLHHLKCDYERDISSMKRGEPKPVGVTNKETGEFRKLFDAIPPGNFVNDDVYEFGNQIEKEINKYEKILQLEKDNAVIRNSKSSPIRRGMFDERGKILARTLNDYIPMLQSDKDSSELSNKKGEREKKQKEKGLNREVAYLFCNYLFEFAYQGNSINKTNVARAEVVEFLTGYSKTKLKDVPAWYKTEIAKIAENMEVNKKIFDDLKTVRKYFKLLGLEEIVNKIDIDLGEK